MHTIYDTYLTSLRAKEISRVTFRHASNTISHLLAHTTLAHLKTRTLSITSPLCETTGTTFTHEPVLVPILRSGLAMLPAFLTYVPKASIGIIGIKRTSALHNPELYYHDLPRIDQETSILVLEPVLATGKTALAAIEILKKAGAATKNIIFVSIISSQEGQHTLQTTYPDMHIVIAQCDKELSPDNFIVPGLGDFGDRFFGTDN